MATLAIPEKNLAPEGLDFRPRALRDWLEALPPTRPVDAANALFERLHMLNRSIVAPEDRAQFIASCRPAVDAALDELAHLYGRATIPLAERAREALLVSRALAAELSLAYRVAAADRASRIIAFGAKRQIPALLLEAIDCLAGAIASSYRTYTPVPAGTWRQLHETFLYAEERGFSTEMPDPATGRSLQSAYSQALLLALADPYRLSPAEMAHVAAAAGFAMGAATLHRQHPQTPPCAHFAVLCDADRPPKPVAAVDLRDNADPEALRILDANAVIDRLRARRAALREGSARNSANSHDDLALLDKLMTLWGDPPKRAFRRDAGQSSVAICAGLNAVRHFVAQEGEASSAEAESIRRGITIPLLAVPEQAAGGYTVLEWDVVNQGAGGLRVRREHPRQSISVGEVLGVKIPGRARWIVAVVRWVVTDENGAVEFGIQFLSPGARVAWIQPTISASPQVRPALVLERPGRHVPPEALMTPPDMFSELREFEVTDGPSAACVRATDLIERTPKFELFEFSG